MTPNNSEGKRKCLVKDSYAILVCAIKRRGLCYPDGVKEVIKEKSPKGLSVGELHTCKSIASCVSDQWGDTGAPTVMFQLDVLPLMEKEALMFPG